MITPYNSGSVMGNTAMLAKRLTACFVAAASMITAAFAQSSSFEFWPGANYDPTVPATASHGRKM